MGCFDSTCSFTRTSIHDGDEILIVGIQPREYMADTYHLADELFSEEYSAKRDEQFIKSLKETAEKCISLLPKEEQKKAREEYKEASKSPKIDNIFRFIKIGKYNDYGSIDGVDIEQGLQENGDRRGPWRNYIFYVHKSVAEELLGYKLTSTTDLRKAVRELADIAHRARIQLFHHNLLGEQYFTKDELKLQRKILKITKGIISKKEKQLKQWQD